MFAWEQIQKTVDYIELHLGETISMDELAEIAALSPFYYQRLFKRLVRKPVAEYIKLRRLAKAAEELPGNNRRILDIALELGFSSHEHFTRVFKSTFGMTPEAYRKNPQRLSRMTKPELLLNYVLVDEGVPLITDGIVLEFRRQRLEEEELFIGLEQKTPVSFLEGIGVESGIDPLDAVWNSFHEKKHEVPEIDPEGDEIGVLYGCSEEGYFNYFAGAKARVKHTPEEYQSWNMLPGDYVICYFEAENFEKLVMDALYKANQYLYGVWLPNHKLKTEAFCAERYKRHDPDATNMELWLRII